MASIALQRPMCDDHVKGCKTEARVVLLRSSASGSAVRSKNGTHILGVAKRQQGGQGIITVDVGKWLS